MNLPADEKSRARLRILAERTFGNATGNAAFLLIGCVVMYPMLREVRVPAIRLILWWSSIVVGVLATVFFESRYRALGPQSSALPLLLRRRKLAGGATMLCAGMVPLLAPDRYEIQHLAVFAFIFSSGVAISIGAYNLLPRYYVALALFSLGPLILVGFLRGQKEDLALSFLIVLWLAAVLGKARAMSARELALLDELVAHRLQRERGDAREPRLSSWLGGLLPQVARSEENCLVLYRLLPHESLGPEQAYFSWDAVMSEAESRLRGGGVGEPCRPRGGSDLFLLYRGVESTDRSESTPAFVRAAFDALSENFEATGWLGRPAVVAACVFFRSAAHPPEELLHAAVVGAASATGAGNESVSVVHLSPPAEELPTNEAGVA